MCPTGTTPALTTAAAAADFRSAFYVLDADRDGKISPDDLRTFYAGFSGAESSDDDVIGSMMTVADSNKDGFVEYEELETILRGRNCGGGGWGVMEEAFRAMDWDGDGRIGQEDLRSYLKWAGFDASDDDIKAMVRLGGGDESQGVTFDGLLKILAV